MRANAVFDTVGAAVHDPHAAIVGAERLGTNLRDNGFKALPHRGAAGNDLDLTVGVHVYARSVGRP